LDIYRSSVKQNEEESFLAPRQAFVCSTCSVYAHQLWADLLYWEKGTDNPLEMPHWESARCAHCGHFSLWFRMRQIYPATGSAPVANPDMPDDIRNDYDEARSIASASPLGAAALLRLCIQKLCRELGQPGKDLNRDIGALVSAGLDERVQKGLDVVRVVGNNAVHPGELDIRDRPEVVSLLFTLVNEIVDELISRPKRLEALTGLLPEGARDAIEKRDAKSRASRPSKSE